MPALLAIPRELSVSREKVAGSSRLAPLKKRLNHAVSLPPIATPAQHHDVGERQIYSASRARVSVVGGEVGARTADRAPRVGPPSRQAEPLPGSAVATCRRLWSPPRSPPRSPLAADGQASPKYLWPLLQSTTLPMLPTKAEVLGARDGDALPLPPSPQPTGVVAMAPVRSAARDRRTASAAHPRMPIHDPAARLCFELGPAVGTQDRAGAQPLPR